MIRDYRARTIPNGSRCAYKGGGSVQCCRERGHDGPHLYKCSGRFCPGLTWIASNTPHPTQCLHDESGVHVR